MRRVVGAAVAGFVGLCLPVIVPVAGAGAPQTSTSNTLNHVAGFDSIRTDRFTFNINNGNFDFPGHFDASRSGTNITADRANGNSQRKLLHAEGHVVVHQNQPSQNVTATSPLADRPSTLTCNVLDVDGNRKLYTATGNMHFTQEGGHEASADRAVLDDASHNLHLEGHVHVRNGEQTIESDVLDYNTQTGEVNGTGNVTITAPIETAPPGIPRTPAPKKGKKPSP